MFEVRRAKSNEIKAALSLALEVFMEFEAPDYSEAGIASFKKEVIDNDVFIENCQNGICPIYIAKDHNKLIGMIGMRKSRTHINMLFTKKAYHHQGVATALFKFLLAEERKINPNLTAITLNSSPYAIGFYAHIGFVPLSEEMIDNGIRYTPMKYVIRVEDQPLR